MYRQENSQGSQSGGGRCGDFIEDTLTEGKQHLCGKKWESISNAGTVRKRPVKWDYKKDKKRTEKEKYRPMVYHK